MKLDEVKEMNKTIGNVKKERKTSKQERKCMGKVKSLNL
jgi:hypothetical protein